MKFYLFVCQFSGESSEMLSILRRIFRNSANSSVSSQKKFCQFVCQFSGEVSERSQFDFQFSEESSEKL